MVALRIPTVPGGGQFEEDGFDPTTELQGLIIDELERYGLNYIITSAIGIH